MVAAASSSRVVVCGKFFHCAGVKFTVRGVTYGPFAPNEQGEPLASPAATADDFRLLQGLRANLVRVYHVPPRWFLDLAQAHDLRVWVDVPWNKHVCFLDSRETRAQARQAVRAAATACAGHPAMFALSVVNEIPADIVRWSGVQRVADFLDELAEEVKAIDSGALTTFGNYPPTEFLRPRNIDFVCFNVYLHQPKPFESYLARLQMIADAKPLVLGEFGLDTLREGEAGQATMLAWQLEAVYREGLAGAVIFSFTDDWVKEGRAVDDWAFGLTTRKRQPKPAWSVVGQRYAVAPYFPLPQAPMVSVVVASYNGGRTLAACLESLQRLNYPNYEVILVDDGSTDQTPEIVQRFGFVRSVRHAENRGLSAARNTGIESARGAIVAYTDSDCRVDSDWLYYLVQDLVRGGFAGIGGHNLLPPEDSWVAAAVMVSPGGPAHVMLSDRVAEHLPGCNMAFYRWALLEIGGFDPVFRKAGDDVDVCWRLQERGYQLGFSPGGYVWHYRRSTVRDYLKQQSGYGEAEALLLRRHPEKFNGFGGGQWRGRIYSPAKFAIVLQGPVIYHGVFSTGFFQTLYAAQPAHALMLVTSLEYHVAVTLPLMVLGLFVNELWPLGVVSALISGGVCAVAAAQAELPKAHRRWRSRPLVALLFFLQPIFRGLARHLGGLLWRQPSVASMESLNSLGAAMGRERFGAAQYWNEQALDRIDFVRGVIERLDRRGWPNKADAGWNEFDIEVYGSRWCQVQITTAAECFGPRQQLFRCRLRARWSFLAKGTLAAMAAAQIAALGLLGLGRQSSPLWWLCLLSLPAFAFWLAREETSLRRVIWVFLNEAAVEMGLKPVGGGSPTGPASPTGGGSVG